MAAASTPPSTSNPRPPRTPHEIRAVAVKACRDPRTVAAVYDPHRPATDPAIAAVTIAARELGFAPPPAKEAARR
jgi:hypothetical protein